MKKSIVLGILIFPLCIFSQTSMQVFDPKLLLTPNLGLNQPCFDVKNYTFQLTLLHFNPTTTFTIYNHQTKLNYFYFVKKILFIPRSPFYCAKRHLLA